jgi:hypothetical protein
MSSEPDASSFAMDPLDREDAASAAFDRMGRRLAGLAAAVEGFAARQQEIHARDYADDLKQIQGRQDKVSEAISTLNKQPGLQMTVKGMAASIAEAGRAARAEDHGALARAQQQLDASTRKLDGIIAGRIDLRRQCVWLATAAGAILGIGAIIGDAVPPMLDRVAPESWQWPEARAADDLAMSERDAGQRLLQVADAAEWRGLLEAGRLAQANAAVIAACQARSAKLQNSVSCPIIVSRPAA